MKVTIEITCDNATFDPDSAQELGRILRDTGALIQLEGAYRMPQIGESRSIRDIKGDTVGALTVSKS